MNVGINSVQFSSVVGGDIGGRGSARLQVFNEKTVNGKKVFKPTDDKYRSDSVEFKFVELTLEETLVKWSEEILALVEENPKHYQKDPIRAIGLAFPGTIKNRNIVELADNLSTNTNANWEDVNLQKRWPPILKKVFKKAGLKEALADTVTVTLANDLVAGALGERVYGTGKTFNPENSGSDMGVMNLVQVGTGYGGSLMVISPKHDVLLSGEPGYKILDNEANKSIEDFIGHHAIKVMAEEAGLMIERETGDVEPMKPKEVFNIAFDKQQPKKVRQKAVAIIDMVVEKLAHSIAYDTQRFNMPKRVITGGGVPRGIDRVLKESGEQAGFVGVLKSAVKKLTRHEEFNQSEFTMVTFENNLIGASILADTSRYSEISPGNRELIF